MNDTPAACCAAGAVSSWASPTTIRSPGIARMLAGQGADLAFTYQGEAFGRRVAPLAASVGSQLVLSCDVEHPKTVDEVFAALRGPRLDFLVHAIAYSDRAELKGRYADTSRENFIRTMVISCFSFTEVARRAAARWIAAARFDTDLWRFGAGGAELQCHGRGQGRPRIIGALSRRRFRAAGHQGQCHLGRTDAHPRRCRHHRCLGDVQFPEAPLAAAAHHHPRRGRRRRGVPAVGSRDRRHRRGASCRSGYHISTPAPRTSEARASRMARIRQ